VAIAEEAEGNSGGWLVSGFSPGVCQRPFCQAFLASGNFFPQLPSTKGLTPTIKKDTKD
jgi:hypothetical protein